MNTGAENEGRKPETTLRARLEAAFTALVVAWDAYHASFVFREELGGWPKVRHIAPCRLVMTAPHTGPRRYQKLGGWKPPAITGAVIGFVFFLRGGEAPVMAGVVLGAIFGFLSIPLWWLAVKTRLKIHFIDGAISWRGPDHRKYAFKPGAWRGLEVLAPHRLAPDEALAHENFMRSYPNGQRPKPVFQASSELIMQTGLGGTVYTPVAEFLDDLSEEQAGRLRAAIMFVYEKALEEIDARAREGEKTE